MIACVCGHHVANEVREGFVITADERRKWMRRRADNLECPKCGRIYVLWQLIELATAQASRSMPDTA